MWEPNTTSVRARHHRDLQWQLNNVQEPLRGIISDAAAAFADIYYRRHTGTRLFGYFAAVHRFDTLRGLLRCLELQGVPLVITRGELKGGRLVNAGGLSPWLGDWSVLQVNMPSGAVHWLRLHQLMPSMVACVLPVAQLIHSSMYPTGSLCSMCLLQGDTTPLQQPVPVASAA